MKTVIKTSVSLELSKADVSPIALSVMRILPYAVISQPINKCGDTVQDIQEHFVAVNPEVMLAWLQFVLDERTISLTLMRVLLGGNWKMAVLPVDEQEFLASSFRYKVLPYMQRFETQRTRALESASIAAIKAMASAKKRGN